MSRFAADHYLQLALEAENQRKKHLPLKQQNTCLACGAEGIGSIQGCLESFQTAMLRPEIHFHAIHSRLFDAYCLQHPEIYCVSAKSYAVHLAFMACWMESDSPLEQRRILHRGMNGAFTLEKALLLDFHGELTHLYWQQADPTDFVARAEAWMQTVWEAYSPLHSVARAYQTMFFERGQQIRK